MKKVVNAIIQKNEKFLVIKRSSGLQSGKWAFPGGIVEKNETPEQALRREIKEETNLKLKKIIRKISSYEYPRENAEKTIGECFLVSASGNVKLNSEVQEYRWVTIEEFESLEHISGLEDEALTALFDKT